MKINELKEMGFIHKHLFGNIYIVNLYTYGLGKYIKFPMILRK